MGCFPSSTSQFYYYQHFPENDLKVSTAPTDNDLLLAMKCFWMCELSYTSKATNPDNAQAEAWRVSQLNISNYEPWHTSLQQNIEVSSNIQVTLTESTTYEKDDIGGGAHMYIGTINNLSPDKHDPTAIICFRGTASHSDMLADQLSYTTGSLTTSSGISLATAGTGYLTHFNGLCALRKDGKSFIEKAVELARSLSSNKPQIVITGHSLGAALATLCAVCMRKEYPDIDVQLVTFGSPRVFHIDSLNDIAPYLPSHLRFANDGDLVSILGNQDGANLEHTGTSLYCPAPSQEWIKITTGTMTTLLVYYHRLLTY